MKKHLLSSLLLLVLGCVACSAYGSKGSVDSIDSISSDGFEADMESQSLGMLKAFGLKGRIKTVTFSNASDENNAITLSFDLKGDLLDHPDYKGGRISEESSSPFFYSEISFDDWKWTDMSFSGRMLAETKYEMKKYDESNRPILANVLIENEVAKNNVTISYSGSDAKGNYTEIHFNTKGISYDGAFPVLIETMNVEIEYWPEDASAADVPTKLSENEAIELIKKANIKDTSVLSADLKKVVDIENDNSTLISDGENSHVRNIVVEVYDFKINDSGDSAAVAFYFATKYDDGTYHKPSLSDPENLRIAQFVYEHGGWKVDDLGWDVDLIYGMQLANQWYKEYVRKYSR